MAVSDMFTPQMANQAHTSAVFLLIVQSERNDVSQNEK